MPASSSICSLDVVTGVAAFWSVNEGCGLGLDNDKLLAVGLLYGRQLSWSDSRILDEWKTATAQASINYAIDKSSVCRLAHRLLDQNPDIRGIAG